ncbi:hypothetical protein A2U01_0044084, partial [Trifolium medium]|nr:hypothetical protein [Trifolium medium]
PDTQREALQKVEMFLDEAWDNLYASFLHSAAQSVSDSEQRRRETMNKACLLRLRWELRSGNESLWCKVLKGGMNIHLMKLGILEMEQQPVRGMIAGYQIILA